MEALLNIFWFLIAAGAFALRIWLPPKNRRDLVLQLVALLCVSVLLLPIISITDDLQAATFVVEDSITKRVTSGAARSLRILTNLGVAIVPVVVVPLSAILHFTLRRSIEETFESYLDGPALSFTLDRAPPRRVA